MVGTGAGAAPSPLDPGEEGGSDSVGRARGRDPAEAAYSGGSFFTDTHIFTADSSLISPGLPIFAVSSRQRMK